MLLGTDYVERAENAMCLVELPLLSPDYKSQRRYQIIYVVRNDSLAEYREDLGPARLFDAPPFRILGGAQDGDRFYFEHTVAELRDMADILRGDASNFKAKMRELQESSTLIKDAIDQFEERQQIINNRSVFGPTGATQRDGFPREEVLRHAKDRRRR